MRERLENCSDEELLSRLDGDEGDEIMDYILSKYKSLVLKKT
ncbi:MAG TPA: RNA polymerase subunit sigma-70, partial [Lachnospiraceae bacterium]|nr:RNA polymerase subunit sigma-70 [Lachnospiraceae bacterium]